MSQSHVLPALLAVRGWYICTLNIVLLIVSVAYYSTFYSQLLQFLSSIMFLVGGLCFERDLGPLGS